MTVILKALSDETRLSIVAILLNHDICAGAIARRLGISDAAVSQHMKVLREAGLEYSDIVKTTVLLDDIRNFDAMNRIYAEYFPADKPARVCYEVAALPKGAKVEIDAVAGR